MDWLEILNGALIFGMPIAALASSIVQLIKQYIFRVEGTQAFLLALAIGAILADGFLFINYPPASFGDAIIMAIAGLVFAFITPGFYQVLKATAKSGAQAAKE